jgi:hypothetical protein
MRRNTLPLFALLISACIPPLEDSPDEAGSSTTGTVDDATTLPLPTPSDSSSTAAPDPTTTTTALPDTDTTTAGSSTGDGGLGEGEACDMHLQDCASGLKCMPYSTDGSTWWNAAACFPIVPDPADLGEPCQWEGGLWSGHDDCGWGQVCWAFDEEPGVCKGLCLNSDPENWDYDTYTCEDPLALPNAGCQECFCVCETPCDPLAQDCGDGQACTPDGGDFFQCMPDASGELGAYGDPCEFLNACDPGLACLGPSAVPGCEGAGCCSPWCDVTQPNTCPGAAEGQECQPWYEPGDALPGLEDIGVCALPA